MQDPQSAPGAEQEPGGASQLVAGIHSNLTQLMDLLGSMPEEQQKLGQIVQAYQSFVDDLGQPAGASGPAAQQTTTPEQGAGKVQPAM